MEAAFADIVGTPPPPAEGKGEATVIWYLKALQRLDKRYNDIATFHGSMLSDCEEWFASQSIAIDKQRGWLDETYLDTVEAVTRAKIKHSGKKSFDFFYGVCSLKKQQDSYEWPDADDEALLKWCENNDIPCKMRVTIDKGAIKAHCKKTGEEPPGVNVTPGVEKFYVKPAPLAALPFEREPMKYIGPEPKE